MEILTFALFVFCLPIFFVVALLVILFDGIIQAMPVIIGFAVMLIMLGALFKPFQPLFKKYQSQLTTAGKWFGLIFFAPVIAVCIFGIIALPFVMIYSLTDNPFIWFSVIIGIVLFNLIYYRKSIFTN